MRVAIVGAGFTGLAAGLELVEQGHEVEIFESGTKAGGLAVGWKEEGWKYSLECFYHHVFANDFTVLEFAKRLGVEIDFRIPITASYLEGRIFQLDSPISLLAFPALDLWSKLRMGLGLAILKLIPNGKFLERWTATKTLPRILGENGYKLIWEPLLIGKFGKFVNEVNLAWFWARVYKRTRSLGYFEGGFQQLADKAVARIKTLGGKVVFQKKIEKIERGEEGWLVDGVVYDKVLITVPIPVAESLTNISIGSLESSFLSSQTMVLRMKTSVLPTYWLNILDKESPFLVAVEHTRMIGRENYGNEHIVYLGNYLANDDSRLSMEDEELWQLFKPWLIKLSPSFDESIVIEKKVFQAAYSQPVCGINYSKKIPKFEIENGLYLANMSQVYPWDRGTNYAVEMGINMAKLMNNG